MIGDLPCTMYIIRRSALNENRIVNIRKRARKDVRSVYAFSATKLFILNMLPAMIIIQETNKFPRKWLKRLVY